MTNEIGLAFSHPIERSVASGISVDDQDVDRISLRDHIVEVEIGAFEAERGTTQRICFNVVVEVCLLYTSPSPRDVEETRMPSSA